MSDVHDLFPSLDADWTAELTAELRIRGVTGTTIGDALATAEAHCRDTGESALDAFGPAREYAVSLPAPPRGSVLDDLRPMVPAALGLAGMLLSFHAVDAWQAGTSVALTLGTSLTWVAILGATILIARHPELVLRGRWAFFATVLVLAGVIGVLGVAPTTTLLLLSPAWTGAVVLVLLTASVVGTRMSTGPADEIRHPLRPTVSSRAGRVVGALTPWVFVLGTLVVSGVALTL